MLPACRRYTAEEVTAAALAQGRHDVLGLCARHLEQQCGCEGLSVPGGEPPAVSPACAAAALGAAVLDGWEAVYERHDRPGRESAAQKAARRDEEALQLLLHLHVLQLCPPPPGASTPPVCASHDQAVRRIACLQPRRVPYCTLITTVFPRAPATTTAYCPITRGCAPRDG